MSPSLRLDCTGQAGVKIIYNQCKPKLVYINIAIDDTCHL